MTGHPALHMSGISRAFGDIQALSNLDLTVPRGAFVVLLGAAGAGKTTTLRIAAGLEDIDDGLVLLDGEDADGLQPKDRDIAMIFDNLALYPNRTGFDNIANPLKIRKLQKSEIDTRVRAVSKTLRIGHILKRLPKTMSGGERQRVALGRALVREPGLFLLDEPLSSLDAMLRVELRAELKRLQQEHGYSFLLATPDFQEALAVADTIVMLVAGEVRQVGTPESIYDDPADLDVARFVGAPEINLLRADFRGGNDGRIRFLGGEHDVPDSLAKIFPASGNSFKAGLRPEHLTLVQTGDAPTRATVVDIEPLGVKAAVTLFSAEDQLRTTIPASEALHLTLGTEVGVLPELDKMMAFDPETGRRIT